MLQYRVEPITSPLRGEVGASAPGEGFSLFSAGTPAPDPHSSPPRKGEGARRWVLNDKATTEQSLFKH